MPRYLHAATMLIVVFITLQARGTQEEALPSGVLSMSATALDQKVCKNQANLFTVYVKLRVSLVNRSTRNLIIPRDLPAPYKLRISTSRANADKGLFIYDPDPYFVSSAKNKEPQFNAEPNKDTFIILEPGRERNYFLWAGFLDNGLKTGGAGVGTGMYYAQAIVATWPYEMEENRLNAIARKWSRVGIIPARTMTTNVFELSIPNNLHGPTCRGFQAPVK